MHRVPPDRQDRVLDGERVCQAIEAIADQEDVTTWASRFGLLGDPTRLAVLLCIAAAGPISVTDLATATGTNDTTISQCLRLLRASGTVVGERDGRIIRYELADPTIGELLTWVGPSLERLRHAAS